MRPLTTLSAIAARRGSRWIVIAAWLALAAAALPLQSGLSEEAADESDTFLVRGSDSARAKHLIEDHFRRGSETAAVIAYFRPTGITTADGQRADADAEAICRSSHIPSLTLVATPYQLACGEQDPLDLGAGRSLLTSPDQSVILSSVLLTDDSTPAAEQATQKIRAAVPPPTGDPTGLRAFVTGRAAFEADRSEAVKSIDETLLAVTLAILLALLLAIYRSPLLALVPLLVVAVAYLVAAGLTYGLAKAHVTPVSGQTTAILIVLMFGVGTDYCLLLVARFREELDHTRDVERAMIQATERTAPTILSAGAIVAGAMLVLALADFNATREMGPILALGVATMVLAGLTLLPAILAALGRTAFRRPPATTRAPAWRRVSHFVRRHPKRTAAAVTALLAAGAAANATHTDTLDFAHAFRGDAPDSVLGQQVIQERFIPGRAAPLRVVADDRAAPGVQIALAEGPDTPVAEMNAVARSTDRSLLLSEAVLDRDPFTDAATDAVPALREKAAEAAGGRTALIGGTVAETYDAQEALARDTRLVVPLSLVLILVVLAALLKAIVMPLYAIATVILSFGFALGVSALVFPASDPSLPLFAFIFLVALGVDYNVFLLSRINEQRRAADTSTAVTQALERTGGVITSAGLVLAATFATLMALPLEPLFQVGFVVALGVLTDTFLVRALLVPAVAILLHDRNWWPFDGPQTNFLTRK